jgi:asparagine synthetase B (glutamine-hydrolysing)
MKGDKRTTCFTVLMADDDADDRFLLQQAFLELGNGGDHVTKPVGHADLVDNIKRLVKRYTSREPTDEKM